MKTPEIKVLDHGYVKLLNMAGAVRRTNGPENEEGIPITRQFDADDRDPAIVARISFDNLNEDRTVEQDIKLLKYLMTNFHNTPIEMTEVWLEMKMPIFCARQFVRHRTACINEVSARYVKLSEEWYVPEIVGAMPTSGAKQGQEYTLTAENQTWFKKILQKECYSSYKAYERSLERGVAPEHARMLLHLNHYTHWVWKQDLHNMMHMLKLRLGSHAQIEAQVYAQAVLKLLADHLPETMKLFKELRL